MNLEEKIELLDILYDDRQCRNCNHAYNCTGYGSPCDNWIRITRAGEIMRDMDRADLDYDTEIRLMAESEAELDKRNKGEKKKRWFR